MLTSSNQYLRPEYLTPLPTTLDAKKSPLALLAQTCSQIGADAPNSKLLQCSEKANRSSKSEGQKEKTDSSQRNSFKHESLNTREKSRTPEERSSSASTGSRVRTPVNTKTSSNGRCSSNLSGSSPRASPSGHESKTPSMDAYSERTNSPEKTSDRHTPSSTSKTAFTPNILTSSSDPAIKDLPLGTFKPGVPPTTSAFLGYPSAGYPLPMDLMTSSLMSQHHALKTGLAPYFAYGRMKAQDTMTTVCRDPYCTGCSVSSHLFGAASVKPMSCPAGCTQCDHAKVPTSVGYMGHNPAAAAYAHAQLAALAAASHLPYVCNWISGDAAYCGKRFTSSEELLAHLRTHTSGSIETSSALSMLGSPGLSPSHPLLHRTYPTPPLSPLATARYHPYSKPSLLPPSLSSSSLAGFPLSHPGLSPYLSPYSLYGSRLGAAPGMHP